MAESVWSAVAPQVAVKQSQPKNVSVLRLRQLAEADVAELGQGLGIQLPRCPNTVSHGEGRALWLGPQEWMIVDAAGCQRLGDSLSSDATMHAADVTDGRVVYTVSGPCARDLIAKGCTLDLHSRAFRTGQCAQTALAQTFIVLEQVSDEPIYSIFADVSYEHHLNLWFEDAIIEFRTPGEFK